ncbi:hypothetical protein TYRP_022329 [Tyrophagus putrescentiae]|nr:hypothetical protein TYRP_022329 [Tyrophagus putrescentiae]
MTGDSPSTSELIASKNATATNDDSLTLTAVIKESSSSASFARYNGFLNGLIKDAGLNGNDPSLMAASLEGARQMAQMMSASVRNRLGQLSTAFFQQVLESRMYI